MRLFPVIALDLTDRAREVKQVDRAWADAAISEAQAAGVDDVVGERALLAVAARVGATRLIDNFVLGEDARP